MNISKLNKFLLDLNTKEITYMQDPKSTTELFKIPNNTIHIYSSDFSSYESIHISKQNRFIDISSHTHEFIELLYVYSGNCYQTINGQEFHLKKGDICIIDTGIIHSIKRADINDIFINILMKKDYFTTSLLSRLSSESYISEFLVNAITESTNHENYIIFNQNEGSKVDFFMSSLMCEYFDKGLCSTEVIDCYLILLFSELIRTTEYSYYKKSSTNDSRDSLIHILKYIEKNYNTCTLESVAKHFNFHPNYLSTFLRKMTKKTYKEIVQTQRMMQAANYLKKTTIPIYEIAEKSGYNNLTFFYKKFREHYGISPQEFRDK